MDEETLDRVILVVTELEMLDEAIQAHGGWSCPIGATGSEEGSSRWQLET